MYILTIQYLDNSSAKKIRLQLQEKLDCDQTDRKKKVDHLVIEIIDEQTKDDDEEGEEEKESESEEVNQPKKKKTQTVPKKMREDSEYGSNYSPAGSDEEEIAEVPSDGGGSDYEADEPVKIDRGNPKKEPPCQQKQLCGWKQWWRRMGRKGERRSQ